MICPADRLGISGPHNLANAAAASTMVLSLGFEPSEIARGLENFRGIAHRLEPVVEVNGVKFINDSKATNVDSVWYALQSFDRPLIVIMGGRDKGGDFTALRELVAKHVKLIVLIGEAAEKIDRALGGVTSTLRVGNINEAVELGFDKATNGEIVLLSPGCASFDQFVDYEDRGNQFKAAALELARRKGRV